MSLLAPRQVVPQEAVDYVAALTTYSGLVEKVRR